MEKLQPYLEAYSRSSDRTRSVYLVILAFSIVCVAAFLNSAAFGWNANGARKCSLAYAYLVQQESSLQENQPQLWIGKLDGFEVEEARAYIDLNKIKTTEEAKILLGDNLGRMSNAKVVQIPIFGLSFHINDLGLVAGLSLIMLMLILKYALTREVQNLELVRAKVKAIEDEEGQDKTILGQYAYEMLSTSEVLHRPQSLTGGWTSLASKSIIDAPVMLLFIPAICYAVVVASDYRKGVDQFLSPAYSNFIKGFEIVAVAGIAILAISCFLILNASRSIWRDLHDMASEQQRQAPPAT